MMMMVMMMVSDNQSKFELIYFTDPPKYCFFSKAFQNTLLAGLFKIPFLIGLLKYFFHRPIQILFSQAYPKYLFNRPFQIHIHRPTQYFVTDLSNNFFLTGPSSKSFFSPQALIFKSFFSQA